MKEWFDTLVRLPVKKQTELLRLFSDRPDLVLESNDRLAKKIQARKTNDHQLASRIAQQESELIQDALQELDNAMKGSV